MKLTGQTFCFIGSRVPVSLVTERQLHITNLWLATEHCRVSQNSWQSQSTVKGNRFVLLVLWKRHLGSVDAVHLLCGALISTCIVLSQIAHCPFALTISDNNFLTATSSSSSTASFTAANCTQTLKTRWHFITHNPSAHHKVNARQTDRQTCLGELPPSSLKGRKSKYTQNALFPVLKRVPLPEVSFSFLKSCCIFLDTVGHFVPNLSGLWPP